jgi:hypothetical protein
MADDGAELGAPPAIGLALSGGGSRAIVYRYDASYARAQNRELLAERAMMQLQGGKTGP